MKYNKHLIFKYGYCCYVAYIWNFFAIDMCGDEFSRLSFLSTCNKGRFVRVREEIEQTRRNIPTRENKSVYNKKLINNVKKWKKEHIDGWVDIVDGWMDGWIDKL